ncbi:hypothetical protein T310_6941 [Rasamsonia emersonii CBS 393.64]|uniref:Uncharacterized protein n=1 Tax=Rasamsonia emersonii (strain ATCC 16479 / CBS 393.64 / IMI 116815) TaxID=1408163 RepID=A0A0F4YN61_RASE3|nr:hypothetical protein T310_6941 [Rasamsonia emersonii CBS 393.64]KKA19088.1 hypothetical protein T310_6941 [Rasamsonia emersonii CBS 393.64]
MSLFKDETYSVRSIHMQVHLVPSSPAGSNPSLNPNKLRSFVRWTCPRVAWLVRMDRGFGSGLVGNMKKKRKYFLWKILVMYFILPFDLINNMDYAIKIFNPPACHPDDPFFPV